MEPGSCSPVTHVAGFFIGWIAMIVPLLVVLL